MARNFNLMKDFTEQFIPYMVKSIAHCQTEMKGKHTLRNGKFFSHNVTVFILILSTS